MSAFRSLSNLPRALMLALLLCIFTARVAVPSGWMPMIGADGGIVLAPCTGMGAMAMSAHAGMAAMDGMAMPAMPSHAMSGHAMPGHVTDHGGDDVPPDGQHGDHPCSGAGVSAGLETPVIAVPLPFVATHAVASAHRLAVGVGRGLAAPPPPATGPPALV